MDARPPGECESQSEDGSAGPGLITGDEPEPHRSVVTMCRRQESQRPDDEHEPVGKLAFHTNTTLGFRAPAGSDEPRYPEDHPEHDDHETRSQHLSPPSLFVRGSCAPTCHLGERRECHTRLLDAMRSYFRQQGRIDLLPRSRLRCSGSTAAVGKGHDEPAPILPVDGARQVAAAHQSFDELAGGLFRDPQVPDQHCEWHVTRLERQAPNDVEPVLGNVTVASLFKGAAHGRAVGGARMPEKRWQGDSATLTISIGHALRLPCAADKVKKQYYHRL